MTLSCPRDRIVQTICSTPCIFISLLPRTPLFLLLLYSFEPVTRSARSTPLSVATRPACIDLLFARLPSLLPPPPILHSCLRSRSRSRNFRLHCEFPPGPACHLSLSCQVALPSFRSLPNLSIFTVMHVSDLHANTRLHRWPVCDPH
jgi:hypothetical protein